MYGSPSRLRSDWTDCDRSKVGFWINFGISFMEKILHLAKKISWKTLIHLHEPLILELSKGWPAETIYQNFKKNQNKLFLFRKLKPCRNVYLLLTIENVYCSLSGIRWWNVQRLCKMTHNGWSVISFLQIIITKMIYKFRIWAVWDGLYLYHSSECELSVCHGVMICYCRVAWLVERVGVRVGNADGQIREQFWSNSTPATSTRLASIVSSSGDWKWDGKSEENVKINT